MALIVGTPNDDTLTATYLPDTFDGLAGTDTVSYATATAAVYADLHRPNGNTGYAVGDRYVSIENIRGSAFADTLRGDSFDNWLWGGAGADILFGGGGADTFVIDNIATADRILDFRPGVDKIGLDRTLFGVNGTGSLASQNVSYQVGTAATGAGKVILFNHITGEIFYDSNGSGSGGQVLIGSISASSARDVGRTTVPLYTSNNSSTTATAPETAPTWAVFGTAGDINGDGVADRVLQNIITGEVRTWIQKNPSYEPGSGSWTQSVSLGTRADAKIEAVADFNGDGRADILYRGTGPSADLSISYSGSAQSAISLPNPGAHYRVTAVGDFNNDGIADYISSAPTLGLVRLTFVTNAGATVISDFVLPEGADRYFAGDFNGDGFADLAYQNAADGVVKIALMVNGATQTTWNIGINLNGSNGAATLTGTVDYNGDGRSELLFSGLSPVIFVENGYYGGGVSSLTRLPLTTGDGVWTIVGSGDFNGDGVDDTLTFNNMTLELRGVAMQNGALKYILNPGTHGVGWEAVAVGDFNADGTDDILWRETATGKVDAWTLNNGVWSGSLDFGTRSATALWSVEGTGDFNLDGTDDILWRNVRTGATEVSLVQGGAVTGTYTPGVRGVDWDIAALADFNGDGVTDILWRNAKTGTLDGWFLGHQGYWLSSFVPGRKGAEWRALKAGDFNGDGDADLVWANSNTSALEIWYMRDGAIIGTNSLTSSAFNGTKTILAAGDFNGDGVDDLLSSSGETLLIGRPETPPAASDFFFV